MFFYTFMTSSKINSPALLCSDFLFGLIVFLLPLHGVVVARQIFARVLYCLPDIKLCYQRHRPFLIRPTLKGNITKQKERASEILNETTSRDKTKSWQTFEFISIQLCLCRKIFDDDLNEDKKKISQVI